MPAGAGTIAVVRGEGEGRAADILEFLRRAGNLNEEASRRHLSEAVCVAIDGDQVVGVNSVRPSGISLIGGRRFWVYRSFLAEGSGDLWNGMFTAAFEVLAEEFEQTGAGCVGLCVIVDDRALVSRRPEAVLPETELIFAGFLEDGRQVRIRYFWGAAIGPGLPGSPPIDATRHLEYPLEERYRIQPLTDAGEVTAGDVLRLWEREGALAGEEA